MSSSISHNVRYDSSLPPGTVTHVRSEHRPARAASALESDGVSQTNPGKAKMSLSDPSAMEITDEEIHSSAEASSDDAATDANEDTDGAAKTARDAAERAKKKKPSKKNDAFVQLFEQIHTLVRELDAHGHETGNRTESTERKRMGGPVKASDFRVAKAAEKQVRSDGSGEAIWVKHDKLETKQTDKPSVR